MLRSLRNAVNENQDCLGDNGEKSSGNEQSGYDYDDDIWVSDCESSTSVKPTVARAEIQPIVEVDYLVQSKESVKMNGESADKPDDLQHRLIRLDENDQFYQTIKNMFISGTKDFGVTTQIEHIHGYRYHANAITRARLQTFIIYTKAVNDKNGGHAIISHAWFGASKDQINNIMLQGFSHDHIEKDGAFGYGLYLATDNSIIESVKSTTLDDDGMRHVLLCRVLLGKAEAVKHGSRQCHPSSDEFQTGVDCLEFPRKLIIWSTNLNTHILPKYVISFKTLSHKYESAISRVQFDMPLSRSMSIKALISGLYKILPLETMKKINEYHHKYIKQKISRHDMWLGFRDLAGGRLLLLVVKRLQGSAASQDNGVQGQRTSLQVNTARLPN